MPKLPDYTALGQSPTPTPSTHVTGPHGYETAVGDAMQKFGTSMQEMSQTIERVQDRNDKYAAEDAYNKLLDRKMDLTFGEDGFTKKKGEDAVKGNLMEDYDERMGSAIEDIGGELSNPRQQKYYRDRARIAALQYKQDVLKHVTTESDVYQKEVFGATLETERRNAAVRWSDPNAIRASQTRMDAAIDQEADRMGWSKKKKDQMKYEAGSTMHIGIIQSAVSEKNPKYARSWFEANKDAIDPSKYNAIENLIGQADLTEFGQAVVDDVITRGLNEQEALAEVRQKYSGDEEEKAKKEIKIHFGEIQAAADDNAFEIYAEYQGSPSDKLEAVKANVSVWDNMSGRAKNALNRQAKADAKGGVPAGGGDYYAIRQMMKDDYNKFKSLNLNRYVLNDGNRKELIDIQTDQQKAVTAQTQQQIMDDMLEVLGGDRKDRTSDNSVEAYNRIKLEIDQAEIAKGKPLTKREIQDIADRMRIEVTRSRKWWWDLERPAGKAEIKGVPPEEVDELAATLIERGQPVTDENIRKLYLYIQGSYIPEGIRAP
jgi:hypothetical protein